MNQLRNEIDQIHDELFVLLQKRLKITSEIWNEKIKENQNLVDIDREESLIHRHDASELFKIYPDLKASYQEWIKELILVNRNHLMATMVGKQLEKNDK